jgi:hypothetical protein
MTDFAGSTAVWEHVMAAFGAKYLSLPYGGTRIAWEDWQAIQKDHLDQGHGIFLSIRGHIIRLEEVLDDEVVVDDPFGGSDLLGREADLKRTFTKGKESKRYKLRVFQDGDHFYRSWTSAGGYSDEWDTTQIDQWFVDELTAEVADPTGWTAGKLGVSPYEFSGGINTTTRDRDNAGYDKGEDTTYDKDIIVQHEMRSMSAVWR